MRRLTATAALAIVTAIASLMLTVTDSEFAAALGGGFVPARVEGAELPPDLFALPVWLTPLGATLIHAGPIHLAMNLVMLVFVGRQIEEVLRPRPMLLLYAAGAYAAAAAQWLASRMPSDWPLAADPWSPMVGASGAISALLGLYALLYGGSRTRAIGPFSALVVHGAWLVAAWVALNLLVSLVLPIAWAAHVGGFVAGLLLARPLLRWRWRRVRPA